MAAALIGAVCFVLIYGVKILNPGYTDWLMNNIGGGFDSAQHYLGWVYYRNSAWFQPPGMLDTLAWPLKSSVIFTDSIPVFAFVFKLLSPVLPAEFQYFGIYGLLCFCLQSVFGMLISRKSGGGRLFSLLGGALFTLSPVMIDRMFRHTALASQWMILMGIYLMLCSTEKERNLIKDLAAWGLLGFLTGGIHLYFLPMTGILCLCSFVISAISARRVRYLASLPVFLSGTFLAVLAFGGFSAGVSAESDGLGDYSFNLNGFINSMGRSELLKELKTAFPGQNEGFAYFGLGVMLLAAAGAFCLVRILIMKRRTAISRAILFAGLFIFISMLVFAISPVVTLGEKVLLTIPIHSKTRHLWSIFRSTGRMIWICVYLVMAAGIALLAGFFKGGAPDDPAGPQKEQGRMALAGTAVLAVCILLQVIDIHGWLREMHLKFTKEQHYETEMTGGYWEDLAESSFHVFVSDAVTNSESRVYESAKWTADHGLTLNNFYFARGVPGVREEYNKRIENPEPGDVFLFTPDDPELGKAAPELNLVEQGRYVVGTVKR